MVWGHISFTLSLYKKILTHDSQETDENQEISHTLNRKEMLKHIEQNLKLKLRNLSATIFLSISLNFLLHLFCLLKGLMDGPRIQLQVSKHSILVRMPVNLTLHFLFEK